MLFSTRPEEQALFEEMGVTGDMPAVEGDFLQVVTLNNGPNKIDWFQQRTIAYDVRILEGCRDLGLRCYSANPELFHHLGGESEIAKATNENSGDTKEKAGADEKGRLKALRVGAAPNIACGARSESLWTTDPKTIEYLKEHVGRQGKCLKDIENERTSTGRKKEPYKGPGDPRLG